MAPHLSKLAPFLALLLLAPACGGTGTVDDGSGGGGGGGGAGADGGAVSDECNQVEPIETVQGAPPDLLLVVDKSGSMGDRLATGQQKWSTMRDALQQVVGQYDGGILFGLMLYPQDAECAAGGINADITSGNAGTISSALAAVSPDGGTPTHTTLQAARSYYANKTNDAGRYVLLATDGEPNCGAGQDQQDPTVTESLAAISALTGDGVPTFVLGFGGDVNNFPDTLQSMAQAGGTGDYFAANSPEQLAAALDAIASEVGLPACSFRLDHTPDDPTALTATQDGQTVPRDPSRTEGWDYDATTNTITFYGNACDSIRQGNVAQVHFGLGCTGPGTVE
jgi:hypothetical protein